VWVGQAERQTEKGQEEIVKSKFLGLRGFARPMRGKALPFGLPLVY
jgi:hypothetical protein